MKLLNWMRSLFCKRNTITVVKSTEPAVDVGFPHKFARWMSEIYGETP